MWLFMNRIIRNDSNLDWKQLAIQINDIKIIPN